MGFNTVIYENFSSVFKCSEKTTIFGGNLIICNFSSTKEMPLGHFNFLIDIII